MFNKIVKGFESAGSLPSKERERKCIPIAEVSLYSHRKSLNSSLIKLENLNQYGDQSEAMEATYPSPEKCLFSRCPTPPICLTLVLALPQLVSLTTASKS